MRTLYSRIVLFSIVIVTASFFIGLLVANLVYTQGLKNHYEQKMEDVGRTITAMVGAEQSQNGELDRLLERISELGYQLYLGDDELNGTVYGRPFKNMTLQEEQLHHVLSGNRYLGLTEQPTGGFIPAIFENRLDMAFGFPLQWNGRRYALFARPDLIQQLQELRLMLAVLFAATFIVSLLLIALMTRYLVRPLKRLTRATDELEQGHYDVSVDTARRDEIGELARRFTRMSRTLKQVDTMRKQFVANVSHEIQSPLTSIRGLAQQLRDRPLPPEEEKKYLNIIAEESDRLSSLSRQLLTLASLERGTETLKRRDFRLDEQLREVIIRMEPDWSAKRIELDLNLEHTVVSGDPGLLYQVWANIFGNAVKFTGEGGTIRLTCKYDEAEDCIAVEVEDTGVGIRDQDIPYIFDRFYKSETGSGRSRSGTGLGLSIARRIAELHSGTIAVKSAPDRGSCFTIKLPRAIL